MTTANKTMGELIKLGITALALRCWNLMDENEQACIRFGMSPLWTCDKDLGGKAPGELWVELTTKDEHRIESVALMSMAEQNGGMIA